MTVKTSAGRCLWSPDQAIAGAGRGRLAGAEGGEGWADCALARTGRRGRALGARAPGRRCGAGRLEQDLARWPGWKQRRQTIWLGHFA